MTVPTSEGHIKCEDGEDPLVKLTEHFYAQGCREFAIEEGALFLRWPDGRQQKVMLGEPSRVQ
jgi:hypothetical protein